jgi:hypothetical protein
VEVADSGEVVVVPLNPEPWVPFGQRDKNDCPGNH